MQMEISRGDDERLLKRVEYERLAAEGYFEDENVELLFGRVVKMPPQGQPHVWSVYLVRSRIAEAVGKRAHVLCQSAYAASDISEPQPDIHVIPLEGDHWREKSSKALLVVEVAESSLSRDRNLKRDLYAQADVDEYWIVDLIHGCVVVYRGRRDGSWETMTTHHRGETIAMLAFPDVTVAVTDVVPPIES